MKKYDFDPILGLYAVACANKIDFSVGDEPYWLPFHLNGSMVYNLRAFKDPERTTFTHSAVFVRLWNEFCDDEMGVGFVQAALELYLRDGTGLFQIPSIAELSQFAAFLEVNNGSGAGLRCMSGGDGDLSDPNPPSQLLRRRCRCES